MLVPTIPSIRRYVYYPHYHHNIDTQLPVMDLGYQTQVMKNKGIG